MDQIKRMFALTDEAKVVSDKDRMIEFTATKEIRDYDGDILKVEGLDISKIKKNKSFLWSHQMYMPPIGKITKIWKDGKTVKGNAQMTSEEEYSFGYTIYKLIEKGYVNNVSISFIPDYKTMEYKEDKEGERTRIINNSTLLEVSAVNVGANSATTLEAKAFRDAANKAWDDNVIDGSELKSIEDALDALKEECESCLLVKNIEVDIKDIEEDEYLSEEETKYVVEGKPYENEHACRLNDPKKYDKFARKNCYKKSDGKCIDFIFGIKGGKSEVQALRYDKEVWTAAAAKAHCKDKEGTFEAAKKSVDTEEKTWKYDDKDWLYLAHHMHPAKNLLDIEELHHCDLFSEKDMKGDVYTQKHIKNGKKHLHAVDTDDVKSVPKSLFGHLGNEFKIAKKTVGDEKYAVITSLIDNKKSYEALEIKIIELELQLEDKELEDNEDDYISQIYDEYVEAPASKETADGDQIDDTLCIDDLDEIL